MMDRRSMVLQDPRTETELPAKPSNGTVLQVSLLERVNLRIGLAVHMPYKYFINSTFLCSSELR